MTAPAELRLSRISASASALRPPAVPYPGLEPFRFADSGIFAAREAEVERLVRLITMYRGVLLYGESGAGKSSVVNAGLLPRLLAEGVWPHRVRVQPVAGQELVFDPVRVSWEGDAVLPSAFDSALADGLPVLAAERLEAAVSAATARGRILLVFDQFEELITLFDGDAEAVAAQAGVLDAILRLLRDPHLPVKLLFVFREDYLAALEPLLAEKPELTDQALRLVSPPVARATEIIRAPFVRFERVFERELSAPVAGRVAAALAERSRTGTLNLSELQIVCERLWAAPAAGALLAGKGVEGLLEDFLKERLKAFDDEGLGDLAIALLTPLVTVAGTRNVVSYDDLVAQGAEETGGDVATAKQVLERLDREAQLVRSERRRDVLTYEIVSEFLVPLIAERRAEREAARSAAKRLQAERAAHAAEAARRRRRWLRIGGMLSAFAMLIIAGLAIYAWDQRSTALSERDVASANELSAAADRVAESDGRLARALALKALEKRWTPTAEHALRTAVSIPAPLQTLGKGLRTDYWTELVSFSQDGRRVAGVVGSEVRVWDVRTGARILAVADVDDSTAPAISADGRFVIVAFNSAVRVYDLRTREPVREVKIDPGELLMSVALSPDGSFAATIGFEVTDIDDAVHVWSVADGAPVRNVPVALGDAYFAAAGNTLIGRDGDSVAAWELPSGRRIWKTPAKAVAASPVDATIAVARGDRIQLRQADSRRVQRTIKIAGLNPKGMTFDADGRALAVRRASGRRVTLAAWSLADGRRLGRPIRLTDAYGSFALSRAAGLFATSEGRAVVLWDVRTGVKVGTVLGGAEPEAPAATAAAEVPAPAAESAAWPPQAAPVAPVAPAPRLSFSRGGRALTTVTDGLIKTWDVAALRPLVLRADKAKAVWNTAFTASGDRLATAAIDGLVTVVSVPSGRQLFSLRPPRGGGVQMVAFDPDGRLLATAHEHGRVDLWNAHTGDHVRLLRGPTGSATSVVFSSDGTRVLAAVGDKAVEWRVADGLPLRSRDPRAGQDERKVEQARERGETALEHAAYGPHGSIAASGIDGNVYVFDRSGRPRTLRAADGPVHAIVYSPDGRYLAAGSASGAVSVWDLRNRRRVAHLLDAGAGARTVQFSGDGRHLLAASEDGEVHLWNWRPPTHVVVASSVRLASSTTLSPDRRFLSVAGARGTTLLVPCAACAPLETLKTSAKPGARELTRAEEREYLHIGQPAKQDPY